MKNLKLFLLPLFNLTIIFGGTTLQSPSQFLDYELGDKFTFHHDAVDYFEHVSTVSEHVELITYGETYEGRPLIVSVITHPNNKESLESIRTNHLITSGLMEGEKMDNSLSIVWLSYSVHGNESSSMEAAIKTLHTFADTNNVEQLKWLEKVVLMIDPCINPDGRDRYANFHRMTGNLIPDVDATTREHREPWPGGRTNHYYHDLNRDWVWQSQQESQQRLKLYNKWLPHIHVDYHEQSYNDPYYFAPAVEPYHELITPWQREFQAIIGDNNAKYFDERQLLYFRNEDFDLLYPGYGDTYPTYKGAIGMTYEKAGSGAGGVAVITSDTDTLTLKERLNHHYWTGLATVEATYNNSEKVIQEFQDFYKKANSDPDGEYKNFIITASGNHEHRKQELFKMLDANGIEYFYPFSTGKIVNVAFHYQSNKNQSYTIEQDDIIIPSKQNCSVLAQTLFEPKTFLSDTMTYDITAWSLPYVFGLNAFAVKDEIKIGNPAKVVQQESTISFKEGQYGIIVEWGTGNSLKFLAEIMKQKVIARVAEKPFSIEGHSFKPGALFISPRGNEHLGDKLYQIVQKALQIHNPFSVSTLSGKADSGKDLGSSYFRVVKPPRVGLVAGDGVSSGNFGEIWHYFEQQVNYPVSVFNSADFISIPFDKLDVLILPNGSYGFLKTEESASDKLKKETKASSLVKKSPPPELIQWVNKGGRLVVIGSAMEKFVDQKGYGLVKYESEAAKKEAKKKYEKEKLGERVKKYGNKSRDKLIDNSYGSIVKIDMDKTHPLAFGYDDQYFALRLEKTLYPLLPKGWNVGILKDPDSHIAGFMGNRIKKKINNNLMFGVYEAKRGRIVYIADNPLFRSFWYNGKLLFGNAVFIVGK